jgi:hypothetical protein
VAAFSCGMLDNRRVYPEIAEGIRCVVRDSGRFAEFFFTNFFLINYKEKYAQKLAALLSY